MNTEVDLFLKEYEYGREYEYFKVIFDLINFLELEYTLIYGLALNLVLRNSIIYLSNGVILNDIEDVGPSVFETDFCKLLAIVFKDVEPDYFMWRSSKLLPDFTKNKTTRKGLIFLLIKFG